MTLPPSDSGARRYVLFGETYSDNLGDGVIADTLAHLIRRTDPAAEVRLVDLSLRTGFSQTNRAPAASTPSVIRRSRTVRRAASLTHWYTKAAQRARIRWISDVQGASACIIGGGQILGDRDFGFPPKIREAVRCARAANLPIAFAACGVDKDWSHLARRYYREALYGADIKAISVRDVESQAFLSKHLPQLEGKIDVTYDPGLWAQDVYQHAVAAKKLGVGLGIQHPTGLIRNDRHYAEVGFEGVVRVWVQIAEQLLKSGRRVFLFSNGAPDDHAFAAVVHSTLSSSYGSRVTLAERPTTPAELVGVISSAEAVIANRLHAHIVAAALSIPSVALAWDRKVGAFFDEMDRRQFWLSGAEKLIARRVAQAVLAAEQVDVPMGQLVRLKQRTLHNVAKMVIALALEPNRRLRIGDRA